MTDRLLTIGKALMDLEPEIMDLQRMAHLVSTFAGEAMASHSMLSDCDNEAIQFGLFELRRRSFALSAQFRQAFDEAPASDH